MKKIKVISIMLIILSIIFTTQVTFAKTHNNYTSQLTKQEKKIKKKLIKQLKKSPQKQTFIFKKTYKKAIPLNKMRIHATKSLKKLTRTLTAVTLDYPEYYWIGNNNTFTFKYTNKRHIIIVEFDKSFKHKKSNIKLFKSKISEIVKKIKSTHPKNNVEKIKAINNWICNNVKYTITNNNAYNAYGVAVEKKGVCDGIASLFKLLCKKFKIPCYKIRGKGILLNGSIQNHAWNLVKTNNSWLGVDSTWNNTIKNNEYSLLKSKANFIKNHKKMIENGKIEGLILNNRRLTFKALKSPF